MGASQFITWSEGPTVQVPKEVLALPVEFRRFEDNDRVAFFIPVDATSTTAVPYYSTRTGFNARGLPLGSIHFVTEAASSIEAEYVLRSMMAFKTLKGQVPQPEDVKDPFLDQLVLSYNGIRIYHTWENRRGRVQSGWGYAVEADHDQDDWEDDKRVFDLLEHFDLAPARAEEADREYQFQAYLRYIIDTGQLDRRGRTKKSYDYVWGREAGTAGGVDDEDDEIK